MQSYQKQIENSLQFFIKIQKIHQKILSALFELFFFIL